MFLQHYRRPHRSSAPVTSEPLDIRVIGLTVSTGTKPDKHCPAAALRAC
jgi:hypothetical protein